MLTNNFFGAWDILNTIFISVTKLNFSWLLIKDLNCSYFTKFQLAIEDLKRHPDLQVKSTDSVEVTVVLLASFTADLIDRLVQLYMGLIAR